MPDAAMFRTVLLLPLLLLLAGAAQDRPDSPARLEKRVADLASPDPQTRESARTELMNLHTGQLSKLADAARAQAHLAINQRYALRAIVDQVVIADHISQFRGVGCFLGVALPEQQVHDGVLIGKCYPGFPAYQYLHDGDVIVGIGGGFYVPIRNPAELIAVLAGRDPGDHIVIHVRRGVAVEQILLTLAPNIIPLQGVGAVDREVNAAMPTADRIWNTNFAPLFEAQAVAAR